MTTTLTNLGTLNPDFSTNPVQAAFMACQSRYQNFSGGFGSGKTVACCFKGKLISQIIPNNLGIVCRRTYPDLRETSRETFMRLVRPDEIKNWKESENALTLKPSNSTVLFRYFDNGQIKVGSSLGWFFIDQAEEAEEAIFSALVGRMRRPVGRHLGMMAMNPNGEDWQYRLFVKKKNPNYAHFDSTSYDNIKNLPPTYIEDMLALYPQDWVDRFILGKWNKMSGLIFYEYEEDIHLLDHFPIPNNWIVCRGLDWGVDAPATCVYVAQSPTGQFYVFDEYGASEKTPEEHAENILIQSRGYQNARGSVMDSTAFHRDQDLKSVADRYRVKGLSCLPATKDLLGSILLVKQLLKKRQLFFIRGSTNATLEELRSWKWGKSQNGKEVPSRGNDHYLDALRYVIFWMYKKNFYGTSAVPQEQARQRVDGFLTRSLPMAKVGAADPVTGLPF